MGLLDRYLRGLLDPFVTLREAHKLMYFMQAAGEPLQISFGKGDDGPYGENLRTVVGAMEGHLISGYADGGDRPDKRLRLVPGAVEDASEVVAAATVTRAHFNRVAEVAAGFESSFGLELLSTVHWVVAEEGAGTVEEAIEATYAWNKRKERFSRRQIALAYDVLSEQGWIEGAGGAQAAPSGGPPASC